MATESEEGAAARREASKKLCLVASSHLIILHDREQAIATFEKARDLDPEYPEPWDMLGRLYGEVGRLGEAERAFQRMLEIADSSELEANALEGLGLLAFKRKDGPAAARYLGPALAIFDQLGLAEQQDRIWKLYPPDARLAHNRGNYQHVILPKMVSIAPGQFLMGATEREAANDTTGRALPQHEVRINYEFAIGKHCVTFTEWDSAVRRGAPPRQPDDEDWGRDLRPVINVSWHDVQKYIVWLNDYLCLSNRPDRYRLPSEAEWEYACRAGSTTECSICNAVLAAHNDESPQPVDSFEANGFGVSGMLGNVSEWVEDCWNEDYSGAPCDGSAWLDEDCDYRVIRGGDFNVLPRFLTPETRDSLEFEERLRNCGFRLARTLSRTSWHE